MLLVIGATLFEELANQTNIEKERMKVNRPLVQTFDSTMTFYMDLLLLSKPPRHIKVPLLAQGEMKLLLSLKKHAYCMP